MRRKKRVKGDLRDVFLRPTNLLRCHESLVADPALNPGNDWVTRAEENPGELAPGSSSFRERKPCRSGTRPSLDHRQKDDDSRRWDQSTPVWRTPIPLHGDNASQALTGPHFIAIKWT